MSELPAGWSETTLCEITELGPKSQWPDDTEIGFVPMSHAPTSFRGVLKYDARPWHEVKKSYTHFEDGDVIFAKVTPCFENGKAALVSGLPNGAGAGSSEFHVLRPRSPEISAGYLLTLIKGSEFLRAGEKSMTGAVGLRRVPRAFVEQFPIPLPPAAEQKRIAQKLDALLAQVDTLKVRIDAIPALIRRLRQSVLNAAVTGRLATTSEIELTSERAFEPNGKVKPISSDEIAHALEITGEQFPSQWPIYALEQLIEPDRGIPYGIVQTGEHVHGGVPTVRCGDIKQLSLDTTSLKKVAPSIEANYLRTRLKGGEVLLAIRGSVGNTSVAPSSIAGCNISREIAMIPCLAEVDSQFVAITLQSPRGQQLLAGKTRGVAQKGINLADVRRLPLALPPLTTQRQIVRRVEQAFALADQLETRVAAAHRRIHDLTQSLLAKAFRGELVPQDPNDEPASVLLERIRAQRAATPKPKRGRKAATS